MKHLKDYVVVNGQEYYVSTKNTFDVGFETMVFESKDKYVTSWTDCYYRHYNEEQDAIVGHRDVIDNLEKCLKEGKNQSWIKDTLLNPYDLDEYILGLLNLIEKEGNKNE